MPFFPPAGTAFVDRFFSASTVFGFQGVITLFLLFRV
jgi:hypothetical protein